MHNSQFELEKGEISLCINGERSDFGGDFPIRFGKMDTDYFRGRKICGRKVVCPLRIVAEELGITVDWNGETHTVSMVL